MLSRSGIYTHIAHSKGRYVVRRKFKKIANCKDYLLIYRIIGHAVIPYSIYITSSEKVRTDMPNNISATEAHFT